MGFIKKESFDSIYRVINILVSRSGKRGYLEGDFEFTTKWEFRKNEYVFGVSMKFSQANLKLEDYTCVMFPDDDEQNGSLGDFDKMADEIEDFISKAEALILPSKE